MENDKLSYAEIFKLRQVFNWTADKDDKTDQRIIVWLDKQLNESYEELERMPQPTPEEARDAVYAMLDTLTEEGWNLACAPTDQLMELLEVVNAEDEREDNSFLRPHVEEWLKGKRS